MLAPDINVLKGRYGDSAAVEDVQRAAPAEADVQLLGQDPLRAGPETVAVPVPRKLKPMVAPPRKTVAGPTVPNVADEPDILMTLPPEMRSWPGLVAPITMASMPTSVAAITHVEQRVGEPVLTLITENVAGRAAARRVRVHAAADGERCVVVGEGADATVDVAGGHRAAVDGEGAVAHSLSVVPTFS